MGNGRRKELTNKCCTSRYPYKKEIRFFSPDFTGGEKNHLHPHRAHRIVAYISYFIKLMLLVAYYFMFFNYNKYFLWETRTFNRYAEKTIPSSYIYTPFSLLLDLHVYSFLQHTSCFPFAIKSVLSSSISWIPNPTHL